MSLKKANDSTEDCMIYDVSAFNDFSVKDWIDTYKNQGIMPISSPYVGLPEIISLGPTQIQYDLLEYATDCVLNEIISKKIYVHLRSLIRTNTDENMILVQNILNAQCNANAVMESNTKTKKKDVEL